MTEEEFNEQLLIKSADFKARAMKNQGVTEAFVNVQMVLNWSRIMEAVQRGDLTVEQSLYWYDRDAAWVGEELTRIQQNQPDLYAAILRGPEVPVVRPLPESLITNEMQRLLTLDAETKRVAALMGVKL